METIELRGHHLGAIYDVVVMTNGNVENESHIQESITRFSNKVYEQGYPVFVVEKTNQWLTEAFLMGCQIKIVLGLDMICAAGCIQDRESRIFNRSLSGEIIEGITHFTSSFCRNIKATDDWVIGDLFGVVMEETYDSGKIIEKACILMKEYRVEDWQAMMKCYKKQYPDKYWQFFWRDEGY